MTHTIKMTHTINVLEKELEKLGRKLHKAEAEMHRCPALEALSQYELSIKEMKAGNLTKSKEHIDEYRRLLAKARRRNSRDEREKVSKLNKQMIQISSELSRLYIRHM